ncbi:MAG: MFS transporter [Opitutaceae bacterium]|nr:MFS transporter [Opitutaceae bacterium]
MNGATSDFDRAPAYVTAAYLFAISMLPGAIAPAFIGAAAGTLSLDEAQLGLFIGSYFLGFGLSSASAYLWIREVNWRASSIIGIVVMSATFLALGHLVRLPALLCLMLANGAGAGLLGSPAITVVGDMTRPERGFSTIIVVSVACSAILLAFLPLVDQSAGFRGVTTVMAGITLTCLLLVPLVPAGNFVRAPAARSTSVEAGETGSRACSSRLPLLALGVMVLFTLGFIGMWAFFERVATHAKLMPAAIGQALAVGTLVGAVGGPLATYMQRRIPMRYCIGITVAAIVITLCSLTAFSLTSFRYLCLVCSFQCWANVGICLIMSLTAAVDRVGRFVALIPASETIGAAAGPMITGIVLQSVGLSAMVVFTIGVFFISAAFFAYVDRNKPAFA